MREPQLRRHDLVWIEPSAWASTLAAAPQWSGELLLADWAVREWPLIVRRPHCNESAGFVPVGLPLPPAAGKRRIAFVFPPAAIVRYSPPPLLADMIQSAPASWLPCIYQLLRLDAGARAYGSLTWEHLTGLAYLTDSSDIDLIWSWRDVEITRTLLAGLEAIDRTAPMRIDGEIVGSDGMAVNWRELRSGQTEVIGKRLDALTTMRRDDFIAGHIYQ
ncbi:malonate decarboxylase holo-[acyl-carrier-protein] synthase [Rhizobium leguminosarum]|uniref:malonate decarboxylase holo-[acyl-carrier-protein] synthase n=1 Tax=Rhizobium leguminosarum TaxID=384 RepID=UPI0013DD7AD3|nr:malonate decarboxylase holo-[acyl-carrier-protein] synthase [Rhizobium leguminosarum]NEK38628.1 malonate decarboxylase holo-[acyl-carrier-protein] synthase [Rhizobium leguminosarum]